MEMEIDLGLVRYTVRRASHACGNLAVHHAIHLSRAADGEPVFVDGHDQKCIDELEDILELGATRNPTIISSNNVQVYSGQMMNGDTWCVYLDVTKEETEMDRIAEEVLQEIIAEELEEYREKAENIQQQIAVAESTLECLNIRLRFANEEIEKRVKFK